MHRHHALAVIIVDFFVCPQKNRVPNAARSGDGAHPTRSVTEWIGGDPYGTEFYPQDKVKELWIRAIQDFRQQQPSG
jgi:hypothetical protein